MIQREGDKNVFDFPLTIYLHGEKILTMVQAYFFHGGIFYNVSSEEQPSLNILGTFDKERQGGQAHFMVLNEDISRTALVAATLQALRQSLGSHEPPEWDITG
ncbi:MAG: hypothetical protein JST39_03000 [Bacteroidetes bacterium]|nr:hypothetical protein [Bacteroidota bacterium]